MADKNMKRLAKKRADADVNVSRETSVEFPDAKSVKKYENKRAGDEAMDAARKNSTNLEKGRAVKDADDLDDHESLLLRKKQSRKFGMLKSMLGAMDDLDGDGIPD